MTPKDNEFGEQFRITEYSIAQNMITQLQEQGYIYVQGSALDTEWSPQNEVILERRLHQAMIRLNPHVSDTDITNYLHAILNIKAQTLMQANQIFYEMLVSTSNEYNSKIRLVDFDNPENNEFLVATDLRVKSNQSSALFDCVIFINGLPLVVVELKGPAKGINLGKSQIEHGLQQKCQKLFYYNQLMIVTNTLEVRIGLVPSIWRDIREWGILSFGLFGNQDKLVQAHNVLILDILKKRNILDLIKNHIIYEKTDEKITKRFTYNLTSPNGEGAVNDRITDTDLLGRNNLTRELSNFYIEYSEQNSFPFYFGIFGRWGMGKSSVSEMLTENIEKYPSEKYKYLVLKIDCSLFHKKDKLWISILNDLLDLLSKKEVRKEVFQWRFPSFKIRFIWSNLKYWLKGNWWSVFLPIISLIYFLYCFYTSSFPKMLKPKDLKEAAAIVSIATFIYGLLKTVSLLIKQNVFLQDNRNENSSYVQSLKEYTQFITLMNKVRKKKDIKILIILDELDRIHKELLPDIIELVQIFKGLNNASFVEGDKEKNKQKENKSIISFAFSFNHDILFPVIGRNVALNDRQLLVSSYKKYKGFVEGKEKDAYIDYYKLGKEFMDKYLDLSIYLEEEMDYTRLVENLFGVGDKFDNINRVVMDRSSTGNGYAEIKFDRTDSNGNTIAVASTKNVKVTQEELININGNQFLSFSEWEIELITKIINQYAKKVEPRKIIRLKNALILLKKLNERTNIEVNSLYRDELESFIIDFLDIDDFQGKDTNKFGKNKTNGNTHSDLNRNKFLRFTEYFIHSKN